MNQAMWGELRSALAQQHWGNVGEILSHASGEDPASLVAYLWEATPEPPHHAKREIWWYLPRFLDTSHVLEEVHRLWTAKFVEMEVAVRLKSKTQGTVEPIYELTSKHYFHHLGSIDVPASHSIFGRTWERDDPNDGWGMRSQDFFALPSGALVELFVLDHVLWMHRQEFGCEPECLSVNVVALVPNQRSFAMARDALDDLLWSLGLQGDAISHIGEEYSAREHHVMRQDDHGHTFEVETLGTRLEAHARKRHYEQTTHKQTFWIEPAVDSSNP